jgi:C4-dicarboxylate transporter, DctM subunit
MYRLLGVVLAALGVAGLPLFALLAGISILAWLSSDQPQHRFLRRVVANVLDDKFANSVILVTIPLFVFVGYLMAESKTPQRIVRAANAVLGWMPGGLAVVCVLASALFTVLTGGSGVTIVAIGGLLYPVLIQRGYPQKFALGLVTSAGAVGLLLPPSPLVLIYGFVTGVDIKKAYYATLWPGVALMIVLCIYAVYVAVKTKIPRDKFDFREAARELWYVKWEALAPVLVLSGLGTGLMELHESAAAAAAYTLIAEVYIYRDLTWKKVLKVARDAMSLAGAIIIILAMATALTNYVIQAELPKAILDFFLERGMNATWQFIIILNVYLFVVGMMLDAFSVLLVSLPLLVPLAAEFNLHPFYLAVIFLLHLEVAYITPPVGLNLFVSAFRFKRPVTELYRVIMPFWVLLSGGLVLIILWPRFSTFTVEDEVAKIRAEAEAHGVAPSEAWALECIQQDRNNLVPCTPEDKEKYGLDGKKLAAMAAEENADGGVLAPDEDDSDEELEREFDMDDDDEDDDDKKDAGADASKKKDDDDDEDEDLDDL